MDEVELFRWRVEIETPSGVTWLFVLAEDEAAAAAIAQVRVALAQWGEEDAPYLVP